MQGNLKKILLTTCCLTLSACGGTAPDGPMFALSGATPTSPTAPPPPSDNNTPTDLALDNLVVTENSTGGVNSDVGFLSITDPDSNDTFTVTIDDARFEYDTATGNIQLKDGRSLDFESTPSLIIFVTVSDASGDSYRESFTVQVENIFDTATDITLADSVVVEATTSGPDAVVGEINIAEMLAGTGYTITVDDARFEYNSATSSLQLIDGQSVNFEQEEEVTLTLTATNASDLSVSETFTIQIENVYEQMMTETQTFKTASVVMEYSQHDTFNDDLEADPDDLVTPAYRSAPPYTDGLYPYVNASIDAGEYVAGTETAPTMEAPGGTAIMRWDDSDNSFNLTIQQGNIEYFHNYLETELDLSKTDRLSYLSIDHAGDQKFLYTLEISKVATAFSNTPDPIKDDLVLDYMAFGMWGAVAYPVPVSGFRDTHGGIVFGDQTLDKDMPTSGSATYTGVTVGYMDVHTEWSDGEHVQIYDLPSWRASPGEPLDNFRVEVDYHREYNLIGDISVSANFTANTLRVDATNMMIQDIAADTDFFAFPALDFHSSLELTSGSNSFEGIASTDSPWMHGTVMGTFYGAPTGSGMPAEVGGIWNLFDAGDLKVRAVGSFGAKLD